MAYRGVRMKKLMEKKKLIIIVSVLCLMVFHMAGAGLFPQRFLNGPGVDPFNSLIFCSNAASS